MIRSILLLSFLCAANAVEVVNGGADVEIVLCSPAEMHEKATDRLAECGIRIGKKHYSPFLLENGPKGLSKIFLTRTDDAVMFRRLIALMAEHKLSADSFAPAVPK